MAKNQINFSKMSEDAKKQIDTFKEACIEIAKEDIRYKKELKRLNDAIEVIKSNRQADLDNGLSIDDAIFKNSILDEENKIRAEKIKHEEILIPLREDLKSSYLFIPENMYNAYKLKIEEDKRGEFLAAIEDFLNNLGVENSSQAQVRKMAERMSDNLGAKFATSKKITENNEFHSALKKNSFNKLFLAVFYDLYIK